MLSLTAEVLDPLACDRCSPDARGHLASVVQMVLSCGQRYGRERADASREGGTPGGLFGGGAPGSEGRRLAVRARARRLPPGGVAVDPRRHGVPAGSSSVSAPRCHHQPQRPTPAPGAPAGQEPARRVARRRAAVHSRGGCGPAAGGMGAGADAGGCGRADDPDGGLGGGPAAGRPLAARTARPRCLPGCIHGDPPLRPGLSERGGAGAPAGPGATRWNDGSSTSKKPSRSDPISGSSRCPPKAGWWPTLGRRSRCCVPRSQACEAMGSGRAHSYARRWRPWPSRNKVHASGPGGRWWPPTGPWPHGRSRVRLCRDAGRGPSGTRFPPDDDHLLPPGFGAARAG
jgi:hypothetical protein